MTTENKYNGWSNYETWCVNLWLDNDEYTQSYFRDLTQKHYNDADMDKYSSKLENAKYSLQQAIKDYVEDNNPVQDSSMYSDLLRSAIGSADYFEIAENMLEEVEKDEELEDEEE